MRYAGSGPGGIVYEETRVIDFGKSKVRIKIKVYINQLTQLYRKRSWILVLKGFSNYYIFRKLFILNNSSYCCLFQ